MTSKTEVTTSTRSANCIGNVPAPCATQGRSDESAGRQIPLPPALAEIALIDAETCAASGQMSVSWWLEEVRVGRAPKPAVQRPRCTRWRVADVHKFWTQFVESGPDDVKAAEAMKVKMTKASAEARARRATKVASE